ncbi:MAG: ABC transporter ATP-binding protein/permease [Lactobacillales bacterium]|nr:ABC transporter ATP-binding protein/permease [Lactobacillales bacterium]
MKKIISYYKPYKKIFIMDLLCAFINAMISVTIPMIIRYITNDVLASNHFTRSEATKIISILVLFIFGLFILMFLCYYYMTYYGHVMGSRIEADMRKELFLHFQKLPMSFYDDQKIGRLMSRMTTDLNNISEFFHHVPEEIIIFAFRLIGVTIILFMVNPFLTMIVLFIVLAMLIYSAYIMPKMFFAFKNNHKKIAKINHQVEENLAGIKIVKSFANEEVEIKKFSHVNNEFLDSKKVTFKMMGRFYPIMDILLLGMIPVITTIASVFILNNRLTISDLITFMLCVDILLGPAFTFIGLIEQFQDILAGYKRFLEILDVQPEIVDQFGAVRLSNVKGEISFRNVSFRHKRGKEDIFTNLNLNINSGEYVALVGASGAGKTTLCNLILRLYDVSGGEIIVDDFNIQDLEITNLRQNIGFVHQDMYFFADTIIENIRYGKQNATKDEIIQAAKKAYAHDFIMDLSDGYDTDIGQRGLKLSGGQKQRLSIARVFLRNPPILIFDEATSALDNESEKFVQKSLEELADGKTTIVIAHRLSTIRKAKRILVLDKGDIVDDGTHGELMEKKGIYYNLYNLL